MGRPIEMHPTDNPVTPTVHVHVHYSTVSFEVEVACGEDFRHALDAPKLYTPRSTRRSPSRARGVGTTAFKWARWSWPFMITACRRSLPQLIYLPTWEELGRSL